jgi:hypothetical protein
VTASHIVNRVARRLFGDNIGCSDGGCVFGHQGGMHTNGGCQCMKERDVIALRRTAYQLSQVARALAAVVHDEGVDRG